MTTRSIYLTTPGAGTTTLPAAFAAPWTLEVIGGGGGGYDANPNIGTGGGGGGYARISSGDAGAPTLTAGQVLNYQVGIAGVHGRPPVASGPSWIGGTSLATSYAGANGGAGGTNTAAQAPGGAPVAAIPRRRRVRSSSAAGWMAR